jgi:hypothetical protein
LIVRPATLTPARLVSILKEVGAWSEEDGELADDATNWERAVWLAACAMAEDENPDEAVAFPLTPAQQVDLEDVQWEERGRDEAAAYLLNRVLPELDPSHWEDLKTSRERILAHLEETPGAIDKGADELRTSLDLIDDIADAAGLAIDFRVESATSAMEEEAAAVAIKAADAELWAEDVARDIGKLCDYLGVTGKAKREAVELRLCRAPLILALV